MVLQKIKYPVLVYNHSSPKKFKNQITSFAPQCDRGFRVYGPNNSQNDLVTWKFWVSRLNFSSCESLSLNGAPELDLSNPLPGATEAPGAMLPGSNDRVMAANRVSSATKGAAACNRSWVVSSTSYSKHMPQTRYSDSEEQKERARCIQRPKLLHTLNTKWKP
jgi:hypothetical protein